jgi:phage tail protein X
MASFNYKTLQGERWDLISYKMYGSMTGISTLIEANPNVPIDPVIPDGTILIVPIIEDTELNIITTNLPPWKK